MLPPSGSQRFHRVPPYSNEDILTPLLVGLQAHEGLTPVPPPRCSRGIFMHTQKRGFAGQVATIVPLLTFMRLNGKDARTAMFISLVGSCPCSRVTATAENFWKLLETTLFLHSLLQHLLWKVLGLVHFTLHLQFLWYKIVPQSKLLGLSEVLLSLFRLVSCLSVLSAKVKAI